MKLSLLRVNPKPNKPHIHRVRGAGVWRAITRPHGYRLAHSRYADTASQAYREALEVGL